MTRISNAQLGEIALCLNDRDWEILRLLRKLKFLKTAQVQRLFYYHSKNPTTARKSTADILHRLEHHGVIARLAKRCGGTGGGSIGLVWYLTEIGDKLVKLNAGERLITKKYNTPALAFLFHALAISETYVQIMEIGRMSGNIVVKKIDTEPDCWRSFSVDEKEFSLRPDLYTETRSGDYTDYFFMEIDLGTESMTRIVEKVRRYHQYYATRLEQEKHNGIFPAVIWLVQTDERKALIEETLRKQFSDYPKINQVITPNRLWTLINDGFSRDELC